MRMPLDQVAARPVELFLLLTGRTEASASTRTWAEDARPAPAAPKSGEAMLDEPTGHEPAQRTLDHGTERAVHFGESLRIHAQELLEVLLTRLNSGDSSARLACRPDR